MRHLAMRACMTKAMGLAGAMLILTPIAARSADEDADLSEFAGLWVYEFVCVDANGDPFTKPIPVRIEPNGEIFEFEANEVVADMERGNWAGYEFQVTFRDAKYPVQLGGVEFGYDNIRFNLEPGGDLFVGHQIYAQIIGSLRWCDCDGVRMYRLPDSEEMPQTFSAGVEMRSIQCRNLPTPGGGDSSPSTE